MVEAIVDAPLLGEEKEVADGGGEEAREESITLAKWSQYLQNINPTHLGGWNYLIILTYVLHQRGY